MFNQLINYFSYSFVQYAIIVSILISICTSLLGVNLVLKRYSLIGMGLSNVSFASLSLAALLKIDNQMIVAIPITILFAIILINYSSKLNINGDSLIAIISVFSLASGYLITNIFSSSSNTAVDVCTTLFGATSILTLSIEKVVFTTIMCIIVVLLYVLMYNKLFSINFDEDFTKSVGVNINTYNLIFSILIAVVIVLSTTLVGSLLVSSLIVFPPLSAMVLSNSFKKVVVFSVIISVICSLLGLIFSIIVGTPVGSSIVITQVIFYIFSNIFAKYLKGSV